MYLKKACILTNGNYFSNALSLLFSNNCKQQIKYLITLFATSLASRKYLCEVIPRKELHTTAKYSITTIIKKVPNILMDHKLSETKPKDVYLIQLCAFYSFIRT